MIAIDLYFCMNAAYDLTLLCVVGIVARKRLYFVRVLAAALLGAAWSVTALIAALYFVLPSCALWIVKMITYLLCPYLMCLIAYRRNINVMQKIFMREFLLKNIDRKDTNIRIPQNSKNRSICQYQAGRDAKKSLRICSRK